MPRKAFPWLLAAALFAASPWAAAQKVSPGLWEHSISMKSQSGKLEQSMKQMEAMMASMPPEQRKMMQDMMAKQGMSMGPKGNSVKVCMSKEDAERDQLPAPQEGCTQSAKRSGNVWQMSFKCPGPPPSSGDGTVTLQSATSYVGQFNVLTEMENKAERIQMTTTGKWVSADCGGLKPLKR